jgi:SEC-C motif-containing protein
MTDLDHGLCPCGSGAALMACCGRYHAGAEHLAAPTPEALMRSRYTAFVLDRRDYLLATWADPERPAVIEPPEPGLKWLGLAVKGHGLLGPDEGWVAFVARYKVAGRAYRLEERSRFVREAGRWLYVAAVTGPDTGADKGSVDSRPPRAIRGR